MQRNLVDLLLVILTEFIRYSVINIHLMLLKSVRVVFTPSLRINKVNEDWVTNPHRNINNVFPGIWLPMWNCLSFIMESPILVWCHLFIVIAPRFQPITILLNPLYVISLLLLVRFNVSSPHPLTGPQGAVHVGCKCAIKLPSLQQESYAS